MLQKWPRHSCRSRRLLQEVSAVFTVCRVRLARALRSASVVTAVYGILAFLYLLTRGIVGQRFCQQCCEGLSDLMLDLLFFFLPAVLSCYQVGGLRMEQRFFQVTAGLPKFRNPSHGHLELTSHIPSQGSRPSVCLMYPRPSSLSYLGTALYARHGV